MNAATKVLPSIYILYPLTTCTTCTQLTECSSSWHGVRVCTVPMAASPGRGERILIMVATLMILVALAFARLNRHVLCSTMCGEDLIDSSEEFVPDIMPCAAPCKPGYIFPATGSMDQQSGTEARRSASEIPHANAEKAK
ncbi:unnamed protein product [Cercospora beticola]|nr:unnamed protein product [Cercospora beticola]